MAYRLFTFSFFLHRRQKLLGFSSSRFLPRVRFGSQFTAALARHVADMMLQSFPQFALSRERICFLSNFRQITRRCQVIGQGAGNDFRGLLGQAPPLFSRVSLARPILSCTFIIYKRLLRRLTGIRLKYNPDTGGGGGRG